MADTLTSDSDKAPHGQYSKGPDGRSVKGPGGQGVKGPDGQGDKESTTSDDKEEEDFTDESLKTLRKSWGKFTELLDITKIFKYLDVEKRETLAKNLEVVEFNDGQIIVKKDDMANAFFIIDGGMAAVYDGTQNEVPVILQTLKRGDHVGGVYGSSTTEEFIATHYDLYVKSATDYTTYIKPEFKQRAWEHYQLVRKIGQFQLDEIKFFFATDLFAIHLYNLLSQQVYSPLCRNNSGLHCSSILNCQTMTRSSIQYLGYQFPDDIELITDIAPTMFDLYVKGGLLTAQSSEKSNETLVFLA